MKRIWATGQVSVVQLIIIRSVFIADHHEVSVVQLIIIRSVV